MLSVMCIHKMGLPFVVVAVLSSVSWIVHATSVLTPPILPLIVRNPYLSAWLPDARHAPWEKWPMFYLAQELGLSVMTSVSSENNHTIYPLLGRPHDSFSRAGNQSYNVNFPKYLGATYDASVTNLTYYIPEATTDKSDQVKITLSFLCPVTPTSTLRQSLPACYLSILAEGSFDVNVYVDVNGQWVSGRAESHIEWSFIQDDFADRSGIKTWKIKRRQEEVFVETEDRAEWGTLYFSGPGDANHESGSSSLLRQGFGSSDNISNRVDPKFRAIKDDEPVFAFTKTFNLSSANASQARKRRQDHALFTIAHVQDPVAQYASPRGLTYMRPLWKSWFAEDAELLKYHYQDFAGAWTLAHHYSEQLKADAFKSGSNNYVDIVALSARQIMGATSFSGTPESPLLFLKEISSDGNCQTVDVIFPSAPFFLYTNPRWLAYLLEPLLEHQLSGLYPNKYSMHDMGTHFPNLTGHADGQDEYMPLEECGNMLIMGLAMANSLRYSTSQASKSPWAIEENANTTFPSSESTFPLQVLGSVDGIDKLDYSWGGVNGEKQASKWLTRSYTLWKQWTGYLVDFSLEPHNQLSTDDFAGWLALQTNLALKGIVGIKAMSEIASLLGHDDDAKKYSNISETYISKWQTFGMSRDGTHAKLAYNWYGSWTTLYSLYADALLCFHPSITHTNSPSNHRAEAQAQQAPSLAHTNNQQYPLITRHISSAPPATAQKPKDFIPHAIYTNQSQFYVLAMQKYGLPLDSRHLYTKSDWEFEAAAVASPQVRAQILDRYARWVNETVTNRPLTDLYETEGEGGFPEGIYFMARPVVGGHFAFLALERACGA